ncbi:MULTISPECIES: PIN domain-containing protein [unclassified Geobacillus]|uniref:PIN domain-containing protein n=1 Tax=unclassified Geobacillus TaxID=2642459 RepID=UPI000BE42A15|nr:MULTISPECIES: PIN domain-containing protein [unclassified Geobacillus]PDM40007.1 PIN domain nuclease [Parageobacillus yumthangensis]RDV21054.1 PIN domain-containing protein [Parageobacillus toebii]TXK89956.1 type II toxin-antitoxin system VapC family toxin [Parageobacillus sp. SY1]PUF88615.1 PIN domain-containing protein [Geobacillus sp. LYN3]TXK88723.1 type II toxin-antitoxin system VapC family toxin [Geobacillus sp. AYS3]
MYILDANVIVRFLANDDEIQSPIAYRLFEKAVNEELTLVLHPLVIAECCWVLESKRYGYTKEEIAEKLKQLVEAHCIKTIDKEIVLQALMNYYKHRVDFTDAYFASFIQHSPSAQAVITWNEKDFKKLEGEYYLPDHIA